MPQIIEDDVREEAEYTIKKLMKALASEAGLSSEEVSQHWVKSIENQVWLLALTAAEVGYRKGFGNGVTMILERQREFAAVKAHDAAEKKA